MLIAVKNTLVASPVRDLDTDYEITWIRIEDANNKPLFIGSFYRIPSVQMTQRLLTSFMNQCRNLPVKMLHTLPNIILNGDFNTPDIVWNNSLVRSNSNYSVALNNQC